MREIGNLPFTAIPRFHHLTKIPMMMAIFRIQIFQTAKVMPFLWNRCRNLPDRAGAAQAGSRRMLLINLLHSASLTDTNKIKFCIKNSTILRIINNIFAYDIMSLISEWLLCGRN